MSLSVDPPMQRGGLMAPGLASYPAHRIITATILAAATAFYMMIIARGAVVIDGRVYFTLFDDAMISMRYAKTLVSSGGLAWNPSDAPIEGFTNLLWTLWMAVLHLVPVPEGWTPLRRGVSVLFSGSMLQQFTVIGVALVVSIAGLRALPRARLIAILLPVTAFLAQAAYSAFVGGDVWEDLGYPNRFIVIAMPGLLAVTLACLQQAMSVAPGVLGAPRVVTATLLSAASLIVATTSAGPALAALRHEPDYVSHDRTATETGLCLRQNTPPDARIAVVWAGSLPYYADRFAIDLLGKMDRKIAASAPKRAFLPGHNKWDYAYSIETYHPDLILQVWGGRPGDIDIIRAHGYEPVDPAWPCFAPGFLVPGQVFARRS